MCSDGAYYGTGSYQEAVQICSGLGLKLWTPEKSLSSLYSIAGNMSQARHVWTNIRWINGQYASDDRVIDIDQWTRIVITLL